MLPGEDKQSQRRSEGAANGELHVLLGVRKMGQLLQQQCCVSQGSLVPACCSQDGSGEPGLQFAGLSCPQQDRVSLGLPAHQSTQKAAEKTCLFVSCLVHATVRWFRGTAGDGEEGKERAAMFFKDIATFIANQTNCPTLVTPSLRQWLASRIDVKHLKWEITN